MIMFGKNITAAGDQLQKLEIDVLFNRLINPLPETVNKIEQLRSILTIDANKYRQLKTTLPYIVCGLFHPPYRKTEYFASIQYFILDIDHLRQKDLNPETLKEKLKNDVQIALMFTSPSNDGLKILFKWKEKCYDHVQHSMAYKLFALHFSKKYNLEQVLDPKTSDVTRACFISYDFNVFYNKAHLGVDMQQYINFDKPSEVDAAQQIILQAQAKQFPTEPVTNYNKQAINDELLIEIKQKLNPNFKSKKENRAFYVPIEITEALPTIEAKISAMGLAIKRVESIHYGKKIVVTAGLKWAEINIFYGKKGFSVVPTPKNGSNAELLQIAQQIIEDVLFT